MDEARRLRYRRGLHALYLPFYDKLCAALDENWQPISGFRSMREQEQLYRQGRDLPGPVVTYAVPGKSFHNYGLATDWARFEEGKYRPLQAEDSLWEEYAEVVESVGLRQLHWERPHNELAVNVSIGDIYRTYTERGQGALDELLKKGMNK